MTHSLKLGLQASAVLLGALCTTACHDANDPGIEYAPQMYESIPYEPLRQIAANTVNPMGINERVPALGTIPLGKLNYYDHIPKDSVDMAARVLKNPYPYTKANLEEGKVLYTRICSHCHGEQGNGQGPVGIKFKGVPNYSAGSYKTMNDGHIYHVIQWGKNRMMPHGSIVNPEERWKIVMYVHVLQMNNDPADLDKLIKAPEDAPGPTSGPGITYETVKVAQSGDASFRPALGDSARNGMAQPRN